MIDINKKYQTRDGRAVRILCVDGPEDQCVIGIVDGEDGPDTWTIEGIWDLAHETCGQQYGTRWNLIPALTKHEGWAAISTARKWIGHVWADYADAGKDARLETQGHDAPPYTVAHVTWED
jgi:hypothetical protein